MKQAGKEPFIRPELFWRQLGLRVSQTVVHLGCGAGFFVVEAAKIVGAKGMVIGVDILEEKLSETHARAKREGVEARVRVVRANIEHTEGSQLPARSADWVLVANILHQSDPLAILHEATRVVIEQGIVVIVDWDTGASPFGPPDEHRLTREEVRQVATKAGLSLTQEFSPSPYHYGLLFQLTV